MSEDQLMNEDGKLRARVVSTLARDEATGLLDGYLDEFRTLRTALESATNPQHVQFAKMRMGVLKENMDLLRTRLEGEA